MDECPICGSSLVRTQAAGKQWWCSTGCGACFSDVDLKGWTHRSTDTDHEEGDWCCQPQPDRTDAA